MPSHPLLAWLPWTCTISLQLSWVSERNGVESILYVWDSGTPMLGVYGMDVRRWCMVYAGQFLFILTTSDLKQTSQRSLQVQLSLEWYFHHTKPIFLYWWATTLLIHCLSALWTSRWRRGLNFPFVLSSWLPFSRCHAPNMFGTMDIGIISPAFQKLKSFFKNIFIGLKHLELRKRKIADVIPHASYNEFKKDSDSNDMTVQQYYRETYNIHIK